MKDMKEVVIEVDKMVDQKINPIWMHFKKYFPIVSGAILGILLIIFVAQSMFDKPRFQAAVISQEVVKIVDALNRIDKDCNILSIRNRRNYVDFLNVKSFDGSEIGCLNLAYPKNWKGPYAPDVLTLEGKVYEIIKTKDGVFVVPGSGVKLPNGLTIGKDFEIKFESAIPKMMQEKGELNYKGQALAAQLKFKIGDWGQKGGLSKEEIQDINKSLEEFNAAMPFTQNQTTPYKC